MACPRTAAAVPEAKSSTPAVGLATVPNKPFPIPVMKPWGKQETVNGFPETEIRLPETKRDFYELPIAQKFPIIVGVS